MSATYTLRERTSSKGRVKYYVDLNLDGWRTMRFGGYKEDDANERGIFLCSQFMKDKHGFMKETEASDKLETLVEDFLERPVSDKTNNLWRAHLEPFIAKYEIHDLKDITSDTIKRQRKDMKDAGYADTTISLRLRAIRAFINWCIDERKCLKEDPWPKKESGGGKLIPTYRSKGYRYTDKEIALLTTAPTEASLERAMLVRACTIAHKQGWREEQIWSLTWDKYDPNTQKYDLYGMKGAPDKWVWFHPKSLEALGQPCKGRVFSLWSSPAVLSAAFRRVRRSFKDAEGKPLIPRGRFHDLKHTAISRMIDEGYSLADIEEITNTSKAALQYYQHANKQKLEDKFMKSA